MHLDLSTLVAMGSFVAACAGVVLLVAWSLNRQIPALALWGVGNLVNAAGILSLALGSALRQPAWSQLGGSLLVLAPGLMWKAARSFDAARAPLLLALLGAAVVAGVGFIPGMQNLGGALGRAAGAGYLLAAAGSLWLKRSDRLAARWPIILLTALHAAVLLTGAYGMLSGSIGHGELPAVMSVFGLIHFEAIIFTLGTAVFILALVKERNEAASRMAARVDPLTGIHNRTAFMESAERVVERCRREGAPVSVLMCDLDRFKAINDTHGHSVGDAVIRKFCAVTAASIRPTDVFGRLGGEEFAIVLPRSSIEAAFARAERIRSAFADGCRFVEHHKVEATVSCGVSASENAAETLGVLLENSDAALYCAKAEGRNRVKRGDLPRPDGGAPNVIRVA